MLDDTKTVTYLLEPPTSSQEYELQLYVFNISCLFLCCMRSVQPVPHMKNNPPTCQAQTLQTVLQTITFETVFVFGGKQAVYFDGHDASSMISNVSIGLAKISLIGH